MALLIRATRVKDRNTIEPSGGLVTAVRALASGLARSPVVTGGSSGGTTPGWLKTTSNTGIASKGLTDADMTALTVPQWSGAPNSPNITGTYTRRKITLGSNVLAPGNNTTFTECVITGTSNLCQTAGSNVKFYDCDFRITGTGSTERVHLNTHPYYGSGPGFVFSNVLMSGGTIFINMTDTAGDVLDCYGHGQDPNNNGGIQHRDGFTCRGTDGNLVTLRRSRFTCDQGATTGALFLQDTYGDGVTDLVFEQNLFEGSGYCMTLENSRRLTFTDNRAYSYGPYAFDVLTSTGCTFTSWTNNYRWANTPPDYRGTIINQP